MRDAALSGRRHVPSSSLVAWTRSDLARGRILDWGNKESNGSSGAGGAGGIERRLRLSTEMMKASTETMQTTARRHTIVHIHSMSYLSRIYRD